ncbi:MAG: alpha-2-macroglobulin family protein, partial [Planctomycetota bacterium]
TPEHGVAEWSFSPDSEQIRKENGQEFYELSYKITSPSVSTEQSLKIPIQTQTEQLLITLDKAIYEAGAPFVAKIFGSTPISSVFLTLSQEGLLLAQQEIPSTFDSRKILEWNSVIPPGVSGNVLLTGTQLLPSGKWLEDGRVLFVKPAGIDIQIEKSQTDPLRPKDSLDILFKAFEKDPKTNESRPLASGSLAVAIVDESVFAFPAKNLAQLYYELENRLRKSQVSILNGEVLDECLGTDEIQLAQQNTAKALYATLEPKSHFIQFGDPFKTPEEQQQIEEVLAKNLLPYLLEHPFMRISEISDPNTIQNPKDPSISLKTEKVTEIDPHLFSQMIFKQKLPMDPFLAEKTIVIEELLKHSLVDSAIQNYSLKDLPDKISLLRRQKLNALAKEVTSSQEFKQLLRERNIPEEATLTPYGDPIQVAFKEALFKKEDKFKSGSSPQTTLSTTDTPSAPNEGVSPETEENSTDLDEDKAPTEKKPALNTIQEVNTNEKEKAVSSKQRSWLARIFGGDSSSEDGAPTLETATVQVGKGGARRGKLEEAKEKKSVRREEGQTEKVFQEQRTSESYEEIGQSQVDDFPVQKLTEPSEFPLADEELDSEPSRLDKLLKSTDTSAKAKELGELYSETDPSLRDQKEPPKPGDPKKNSLKTDSKDTLPPGKTESKLNEDGEKGNDEKDTGTSGNDKNQKSGGGGAKKDKIKQKQKPIPLELEKMIKFRKYFPETLLFEPSVLITNGKGKLHIPSLPDSMTTFRIDATLSTTSGEIGYKKSEFEIFKPFFVDLNLPSSLTVHDEIEIPIILHNYSQKDLKVILLVKKENWFEVLSLGDSWEDLSTHFKMLYIIPPQKVQMIEFPIHILKPGNKSITVSATSEESKELTDGITKNILVFPEGQKKIYGSNYLLTTPGSLNWSLPEKAKLEETQVLLQIYPDLLSHLRNASGDIDSMSLGGLDDIFNQGFPVLFLYQALKAENRLTLEEELQISYVYQRLLSYQAKTGFSRFRKEAPNILYTTLGLWMLNKMKPFQSWQSPQKDSKLIARCKKAILDQYKSEQGFISFNSTFAITENNQALTSFIYWVLSETDVPPEYLSEMKKNVQDQIPSAEEVLPYALYLLAIAKEDPILAYKGFQNLKSINLAEDLAVRALRVIALQGNYPTVTDDIRCLLENKQSQGGWQSLFLNLFATQALVLYHQQQKRSPSIQFQLDDKIQTLEPGLVYTLPLESKRSECSWKIQSSQPLFCQLITTYYLPWEKEPSSGSTTSLKVEYKALDRPVESPHWEVQVDFQRNSETFKAPLVLEIGIPPGFVPTNLADIGNFYIESYEQTARHLLVYLKPDEDGFAPQSLTFSIRLRPLLRMKVQVPPSGYRELAFQGKTKKQFAENKINTFSPH